MYEERQITPRKTPSTESIGCHREKKKKRGTYKGHPEGEQRIGFERTKPMVVIYTLWGGRVRKNLREKGTADDFVGVGGELLFQIQNAHKRKKKKRKNF